MEGRVELGGGTQMPASTPEPNLVTNLFLIEDIMLTLENIKQENFQLLTNQVYCFLFYTPPVFTENFDFDSRLSKACTKSAIMFLEF